MNVVGTTLTVAGIVPPPARRADAGTVRLGGRDVVGLLCAATCTAPPMTCSLPS